MAQAPQDAGTAEARCNADAGEQEVHCTAAEVVVEGRTVDMSTTGSVLRS
jgi:hypothetical protein